MGDVNEYDYKAIKEIANHLKSKIDIEPKLGIICGSGLGSLGDCLEDATAIPYEDIPNFPVSTVVGHAGKLIFGTLSGLEVVCMQGRFHYYEGYPLWKCAMPVRVMKLLGIRGILITNAAGGVNPRYKVGDMMLIKDHVNWMGFAGNHPLRGPNEEKFGPRFGPMNRAYDRELMQVAREIWECCNPSIPIHEGVYTQLGGPNYETIAEIKLLRKLGIDAVGMSTVPEVMVAHHAGIKVLAFSLITNECISDYDSLAEPKHSEVVDASNKRQSALQDFVKELARYLSKKWKKCSCCEAN